MTKAFIGSGLAESDAVELALVQIDHRPLASPLASRATSFYSVLKHVSGKGGNTVTVLLETEMKKARFVSVMTMQIVQQGHYQQSSVLFLYRQ